MAERDDGGPAFPVPLNARFGMSLRDWFAGQALAGLLANELHDATWDGFAADAYGLADAMIAAKREREGQR